jgi:hypothetical protein
MFSYLKEMILGKPSEAEQPESTSLQRDDVSRILSQEDLEDVLSSSLQGTVTL